MSTDESARYITAVHEAGHAIVAIRLGHRLSVATIKPSEDDHSLGSIVHGIAEGQTDYEAASVLAESMVDIAGSPIIADALERAEAEDDVGAHLLVDPIRQALLAFEAVANSAPLLQVVTSKLTELVHESRVMVSMAGEAAECVLDERAEPDWTRGAESDRKNIDRALDTLADLDHVAEYDGTFRRTPYLEPAYFEYLWARTMMQVRADWRLVEAVAAELFERETLSGEEVESVISRTRREAMNDFRRGVPPT